MVESEGGVNPVSHSWFQLLHTHVVIVNAMNVHFTKENGLNDRHACHEHSVHVTYKADAGGGGVGIGVGRMEVDATPRYLYSGWVFTIMRSTTRERSRMSLSWTR